jgi:type IV secretion system protein VirD4
MSNATLINLTTAFSLLVVIFLTYCYSVWKQRRAMQALLESADAASRVAHGTADWNDRAFPATKAGALFIGAANGSAMFYEGDQHLITLAPTRTGKGTCHIVPNLLTYPGSVIVNDIKGENFALTHQKRLEFGQVFRFAPFDESTDSFNPLDFVRRGTPTAFDDAMLIADMMIVPSGSGDSQYWEESARGLLAGLVLYVVEHEPDASRKNLQRVRELLTRPPRQFLEFVEAKMAASPHAFVARSANMLLQKADKERSGVISTAQTHTAIWESPQLARATTISTFRIEELRDTVGSLYLVIPPEYLSTYKSVLRLMLGIAMSTMTRLPPTQSDRPLTFFVDEFPSLRYMQPIVDAIAYLAGYDCRLWLFAQDLGQIREVYRDKATSILANCGLRSFFGVADYETAEYVSKMAGRKTVLTSTRSLKTSRVLFWDDFWGLHTYNLQYSGVDLITPDEVMRLPVRGNHQRQIVFIQGQAPVFALKIPYHVIDQWRAAVVRAPVESAADLAPMPDDDASLTAQQFTPVVAAPPDWPSGSEAVANAFAKAKPLAVATGRLLWRGATTAFRMISLAIQRGHAYLKSRRRKDSGNDPT